MNQSSINNKIVSIVGGVVVFFIACYFVFTFINKDETSLSSDQDFSSLIKPEIMAYLQSIEKEKEFLKDKNIIDSPFVEKLDDNTEIIESVYPKGRNNPFIP